MTQAVLRTAGERHLLDPQKEAVVKDLERHGYLPDPHAETSGGLLYWHPSAPSLLVRDDGSMVLPAGQPARQGLVFPEPPRQSIRWHRALLFFSLLASAIFLGLLVTALIVE